MKPYKFPLIAASLLTATMTLSACSDEIEMRRPPKYELPELPVVENIHKYKAPLYWSVYEYCYTQEQQGVANENMDIDANEWERILTWMERDLKPAGYNMVCTDGWIPMTSKDASGYMTHYGSMALSDLVARAKAHGLEVGVYDNPLWIHAADNTPIEGTDYKFGNLRYNGLDAVRNPSNPDMWFTWAVASHAGAKEYIDGFFKHYHDLGIKFIRMDFLSWYEDGTDRNIGTTGRGYGRDVYARALAYIAESANKYGIFTSLVMPHLYDDAVLEKTYGNMFRIVADTGTGGWWHVSEADRGKTYTNWPNCMNQFDGYAFWSHVAGRDKVILDGDFQRLNTLGSDDEKRSAISLQLLAGGPVAVADQYSTIGDNLKFYTNTELLALNADRFAGRPVNDKPGEITPVWYGRMSNGDWVIGLFNRSDSQKSVTVKLADLGIEGTWQARNLWTHSEEGTVSEITANLPTHGCKVVRLHK